MCYNINCIKCCNTFSLFSDDCKFILKDTHKIINIKIVCNNCNNGNSDENIYIFNENLWTYENKKKLKDILRQHFISRCYYNKANQLVFYTDECFKDLYIKDLLPGDFINSTYKWDRDECGRLIKTKIYYIITLIDIISTFGDQNVILNNLK